MGVMLFQQPQKGFDLALAHMLLLIAVMVFFGVLYYTRRFPGIESYRQAAGVAETHGGQIIILSVLGVLFSVMTVGFGYYIVDGRIDGTIKADDATVTMIFGFMSGTAGGIWGALIKTMSAPATASKE